MPELPHERSKADRRGTSGRSTRINSTDVLWLNAHRAATTKATKLRASPRTSAVPTGVPGHPRGPTPSRRLTRSLVTLTVRWTVPRAPVGTFSARRDLVRQSRAAACRAGRPRSQRMPFRRLRRSGCCGRPRSARTGSAWSRSAGARSTAQGVHTCRPGAERERHSEPAAANAAARGSSSAMSWSSSVGVRTS
jgi:hypothetical protein